MRTFRPRNPNKKKKKIKSKNPTLAQKVELKKQDKQKRNNRWDSAITFLHPYKRKYSVEVDSINYKVVINNGYVKFDFYPKSDKIYFGRDDDGKHTWKEGGRDWIKDNMPI
jgi:hypothetical protein